MNRLNSFNQVTAIEKGDLLTHAKWWDEFKYTDEKHRKMMIQLLPQTANVAAQLKNVENNQPNLKHPVNHAVLWGLIQDKFILFAAHLAKTSYNTLNHFQFGINTLDEKIYSFINNTNNLDKLL